MTTTEAQAQQRRYPQAIAPHQIGALPLALNRRNWLNSLLLFAIAALLLLAADVALLRLHPGAYTVPIGNYRDKLFLEQANYQEQTPDGQTYRWTTGDSVLRLNQLGNTRHASLTLDLGGRPEAGELSLTLNGQPWVRAIATVEPRHYRLLLPPSMPQDLAIGLNSPTFTVPGDSRRLGVKVEGFALTLERDSTPLPMPTQYFAQLAIMLAALLSAIRLNWRLYAQAALLLALLLALAALLSGALLLTYAYLPQLAIAALGLAALTWLVLPLAERYAASDERLGVREVRLLWALMLGACALRLSGVLYPTFAGQDLGLNLGRLFKTFSWADDRDRLVERVRQWPHDLSAWPLSDGDAKRDPERRLWPAAPGHPGDARRHDRLPGGAGGAAAGRQSRRGALCAPALCRQHPSLRGAPVRLLGPGLRPVVHRAAAAAAARLHQTAAAAHPG